MTATVMPADVVEALKPEYVAPFVAYLVHESCEDNGALYEVGAGYVAKQRWQRSAGVQYPVDKLTPELIASQWEKVGDFENEPTNPEGSHEMMGLIMENLQEIKEQKAKAKL